jgi:glucans biosynthesis protein
MQRGLFTCGSCQLGRSVNRRQLLQGSIAVTTATMIPYAHGAPPPATADAPFAPAQVREMARALAARPYEAPDENLPDALKSLDFDQYRAIRFLPERALWRGENRGFEAQPLHRGFLFKSRVDLYEVIDGKARKLQYKREDFSVGEGVPAWPDADYGFAGFRLYAPINRPDVMDEVCAYLGASYFRAIAKGEAYGLSARGLAVDTGDPKGEEFPLFKSFWIERPAQGATSVVVHALLDSKSAAGSYRFTIRPGSTTIFDVEMSIYPRADVEHGGLAPLTSMYFFGPNGRGTIEDFRPEVHDSDGLMMETGHGEELWRPLSNPKTLQVSAFVDQNPRSFGLLQRQRRFAAYQDIDLNYERRPSLVVEPIGDWGEGEVLLFEIPTDEEVHDNIVAFWRPKATLAAKGEFNFTYRLHWGPDISKSDVLARFARTGVGAHGDGLKMFVLELEGERLKTLDPKAVKGVVSVDKGEVRNIVTQANPETGGWRMTFDLAPKDAPTVELRAFLAEADKPVSEIWIYRWTT